MLISDYNQFGSTNSEVGPLMHTLAHLGVTVSGSEGPYSEALLFGIGGGVGFSYFLFEKKGTHPVHIGVRIHTKETERPEFLQTIASRIGVRLQVLNSSSASAAAANLKRALEQGQTPIVWVDSGRLPYLGLIESSNSYYSVVVYGLDEAASTIEIADRSPSGIKISAEDFRKARETSWSPKYRAVTIQPGHEPVDLQTAIDEGIRDCATQLREGLGITNFGLRGLEKWATVLVSTREKKSWPKVFPPGPALFDTLYSIYQQIACRDASGAASRGLYADFLEEAAERLSRPPLREAAERFRCSEQLWNALADAHLPADVPLFAEARRLTWRQKELFETQGTGGADEIESNRRRLEELAAEARTQFPLDANDSRALLNDLRQRVLRTREIEAEAVTLLENAVRVTV